MISIADGLVKKDKTQKDLERVVFQQRREINRLLNHRDGIQPLIEIIDDLKKQLQKKIDEVERLGKIIDQKNILINHFQEIS